MESTFKRDVDEEEILDIMMGDYDGEYTGE